MFKKRFKARVKQHEADKYCIEFSSHFISPSYFTLRCLETIPGTNNKLRLETKLFDYETAQKIVKNLKSLQDVEQWHKNNAIQQPKTLQAFLLITPNNDQILLSDLEQGYPSPGDYCFYQTYRKDVFFYKIPDNYDPDEETLYRTVLAANDGFDNLPKIINQFDMSWVPKIPAEKTFTTQDITNLRNKLYDMLPTGEITAFDLIKQIKAFIEHMDELTNVPNKPMLYKVQVENKDGSYYIMEIDKTISLL